MQSKVVLEDVVWLGVYSLPLTKIAFFFFFSTSKSFDFINILQTSFFTMTFAFIKNFIKHLYGCSLHSLVNHLL